MHTYLIFILINTSKTQEEEWKANQHYMDNIAKYPKDWYESIVRKTKPKKLRSSSIKSESASGEENSGSHEHLPSITPARTRDGVF